MIDLVLFCDFENFGRFYINVNLSSRFLEEWVKSVEWKINIGKRLIVIL